MGIAIIGGGNMGKTYAKAFIKEKVLAPEDLFIYFRKKAESETDYSGLTGNLCFSPDKHISGCSVVILAVKPQDFNELSADLKPYLKAEQLVLSIMAGISIDQIRSKLSHHKVVRAMPNIPAKIGLGITAFVVPQGADKTTITEVYALLGTTGKALQLDDESLLDAVTALSGSGPAYFYYFVKQLIEAGKQMGIDENASRRLVLQTMLGAYHLMEKNDQSLDALIDSVASKDGTTEAALKTFEKEKIGQNVQDGLFAALQRAKELAI
ncbi:MAG: pyrroline-5-carboxylate reductase [Brumimicrobium sp.]|nr:pyrroline-5-carboxylate reductase [Brumimicrobium sp.]